MHAQSPSPPRVRHVVGCMTGTSLDGLDVALTRITGTGLDLAAEFIGRVSAPLPHTLRTTLRSMANGEPHPPIEFMRAARHLGVVHAETIAELIAAHGSSTGISGGGGADFVVAHGQTIWHAPADRLSWQLFDPWPIVRTLNLPVCYDLRQADLVAGGEGAPITPIADWVIYRQQADAVVNLGGICNATWLSNHWDKVQGEDLLPCNILLDGLCKRLFNRDIDLGGQFAIKGSRSLVANGVLAESIEQQIRGLRSLGRELFPDKWFDDLIVKTSELASPNEVLRTAVEFVAISIAQVVQRRRSRRVVLVGGGVNNPVLVEAIKKQLKRMNVCKSDEIGIPCEAREAVAFAVLGALSADGVPITLPQVTGVELPGVAGTWAYPDGPPLEGR